MTNCCDSNQSTFRKLLYTLLLVLCVLILSRSCVLVLWHLPQHTRETQVYQEVRVALYQRNMAETALNSLANVIDQAILKTYPGKYTKKSVQHAMPIRAVFKRLSPNILAFQREDVKDYVHANVALYRALLRSASVFPVLAPKINNYLNHIDSSMKKSSSRNAKPNEKQLDAIVAAMKAQLS